MKNSINKRAVKLSAVFLGIFIFAVALVGVFQLIVAHFYSKVNFIHAGERWSSDASPYAVLTVYMDDSAAVSANQIEQWSYRIDSALLNASVTPKENARSWTYCYAAEDTLSVMGPKSSVNAEVLAVGGDFFVFHPTKFTYGSAFLNDNSNPMGVVLDRNLAWKLFGAENIIGMEVTIGNESYTVVGIAEPESDYGAYGYAYGDRPRMYMSYAGYSKIGSESVTVFEAALPNSVKGFARNIFDSVITGNEETTAVAEASDRYSIKNRWNNMKELKYSLISNSKIEYPFWENEARVYDYYAAVFIAVQLVLAVTGLLALLISIIIFIKSGFSPWCSIKHIAGKTVSSVQNKRKKLEEKEYRS